MSFEEPTEEELTQFNDMAQMFELLRQVRHENGQQEYGVLTFMTNDVIRMMAEELADTANYCQYQFIKLMVLQERLTQMLEAAGSEEQLDALGINTFEGAGKAWDNANRPDSAN